MTSWLPCEPEGLVTPRPGDGVCPICFNLINTSDRPCRACLTTENHLDALLPISYTVGGDPLHMRLVSYKREADSFVPIALSQLAAMLDAFLGQHERCLGGGRRFDLVTTVPSSDPNRDRFHPLRRIVSQIVPVTAARHRRLLLPGDAHVRPHVFDLRRFQAIERLSGERILLVDDLWTTGASAQSAAASLHRAGAAAVAAVVIGRYLSPGYRDNLPRLRTIAGGFDWSRCALCTDPRPVPRLSTEARPHQVGANGLGEVPVRRGFRS
jgi:predicted amidophosphoribosyltransferase